ncbi:MAG: hypothetical protein Q4C53_03095 [Clostridia bacterium]|nr:hypothetical protein [Clostridia bacterium]
MSETKHGSFPAQPEMGAYVLREPKGTPDIILFANANRVDELYGIADILAVQGYTARIAVVSSKERFCQQEIGYRRTVFSPEIPARLALYQNPFEEAMFRQLSRHVLPWDTSRSVAAAEALAAIRGE